MTDIDTLRAWLDTLPGKNVAIDDAGLALVELDANDMLTGAYLEIGGIRIHD